MALGRSRLPCSMDPDICMKPGLLIPVKRKRASPSVSMDAHKEEMRFYYLGLNYTVKQVRDTMESYYNLGASLIQYRERLNKWGFKKRGTKKQWEAIAKATIVRGDQKQSEAIINDEFVISSVKVKKEIARKFGLSELAQMKVQASQENRSPLRSPNLGTVDVRSPISDSGLWPILTAYCIPTGLLNSLPIRISDPKVIKICKEAFLHLQDLKTKTAELFVIKSQRFKELRLLLYRLSNRLLDFEVINGILDRLKAGDGYESLEGLISLNTISVEAACPSLLLVFGVRLESRFIQLIYQHHPKLTSAYIYRLNQLIYDPVAEGLQEGVDNLHEVAFLRKLAEDKTFPNWNANSLRFLRSCFRNPMTSRQERYTRHQLWSLAFLPDAFSVDKGLSTPVHSIHPFLSQSLRLGCRIEINLLILRALLLDLTQEARVLLHSVKYAGSVKVKKVFDRSFLSRMPHLRKFFWTDVSPFLDAYLTPKHLCHFMCALVFAERANLLGLTLQYIQNRRSIEDKRSMEEYIKDIAFAGYWTTGCFQLYASVVPIKFSKTQIEDSLAIFWSKSISSRDLEARVQLLRSFGNLLNSRAHITHIYLKDKMPHLIDYRDTSYTLKPFLYAQVRLDNMDQIFDYAYGEQYHYDTKAASEKSDDIDWELPVMLLHSISGGKTLIPLLSPWEKDSTVFDSLFWLSSKSCYLTCSDCSCTCNLNADLSNSDELRFRLYKLHAFMHHIFGVPMHDIRKIDGRITLWDSAGRLAGQSQTRRYPPHRTPSPMGSPGPGFHEIFASFDWNSAISLNKNKRLPFVSVSRGDSNASKKGISFNEALSFYNWKLAAGIVGQSVRAAAEYVFDILEYLAYENFEFFQIGIEWVKRLFREFKADIGHLSDEEGLIPKSRKGRSLLQVAADWFNNVEILRLFVDEGADVNAPGPSDIGTALQSCCRRPTTIKSPGITRIHTVRFLVEAGANVNPQESGGKRPQFTPLDGAVLTGDLAVARYLLEHGACADTETVKYAVTYGRLDIVSLLVQFDMRFHDQALSFAKLYGEGLIEEYLEGCIFGEGLYAVPSEFVAFSRVEEMAD